jgi:hypothetical protein
LLGVLSGLGVKLIFLTLVPAKSAKKNQSTTVKFETLLKVESFEIADKRIDSAFVLAISCQLSVIPKLFFKI